MSAQPTPPIAELGLFTGMPQHENFSRLKDLVPTRAMNASTAPFTFAEGELVSFDGNVVRAVEAERIERARPSYSY